MNDLTFAIRQLRNNPVFALVAVLTLALGIGANTAIFSVVNAVLLRPLPYPESDQLVQICRQGREQESAEAIQTDWLGGRELEVLGRESQVLSHLTAYAVAEMKMTGGENAQQVHGGLVTASFLPMLGACPVLGRSFLPEEDQPGAAPAAILSHASWQRWFQGRIEAVGQTVTLNRRTFTVVGVLPASFRFVEDLDVYVSLAANEEHAAEGMEFYRKALGRLKAGVSLAQAQAALDGVYQRTRGVGEESRLVLAGFQGQVVRRVKLKLLVFLGAVTLVLLIACANVANLLLVRVAVRRKEMAVRLALGAGRRRLIRQLLTESVVLALLGAGGGVVLAGWLRGALGTFAAGGVHLQPVCLDAWVLGFTLVMAIAAGVLSGLAPALATSQVSCVEDLKEGAGSVTGGRRAHRWRSVLVVAEVAVAMVLLCGAGLLTHSFVRLQAVDLGYQPERLLTFTLNVDPGRFPNPRSRVDYFERLIGSLRSVAGVETVGANTAMPMIGYGVSSTMLVEGRPQSPSDSVVTCPVVNGDYFRTLGIRVLQGRVPTDLDREGAPEAVVVNESVVRRHFPNEEPLGKRIMVFLPQVDEMKWRTIVGVVEDTKLHGLEQDAPPQVYLPYLQVGPTWMTLAVRTEDNPLSIAPAVRHVIQQVDKEQIVPSLMTMEQRLTGSVAPRRVNMLLLGAFAALALGLAAVGIYGLVACSVSQQTHEIGIRLALGAQQTDVLRSVVHRGMSLAAIGVGIGIAAALALTRLLGSLLFGITPTDPWTFCGVALLLLAIALFACWLPARRAARVDPMEALRWE